MVFLIQQNNSKKGEIYKMALTNLEKQQAKFEKQKAQLENLNKKIKNEKSAIEKKLGHEIISVSKLDYTDLSNEKIEEIANAVSELLTNVKQPENQQVLKNDKQTDSQEN